MNPKEAEHRQQEAESLVEAARERECETCGGTGCDCHTRPEGERFHQPCPDCKEKKS